MATVVKLASTAMFKKHFYEFAGQKFQQQEGGPIGLRGTCSIARLTMQVFDKKWINKLEDQGVDIKLYFRYMDAGRSLLHPFHHGWRWSEDGRLQYSKSWAEEDGHLTPTEVTKRILLNSMRDVEPYLR